MQNCDSRINTRGSFKVNSCTLCYLVDENNFFTAVDIFVMCGFILLHSLCNIQFVLFSRYMLIYPHNDYHTQFIFTHIIYLVQSLFYFMIELFFMPVGCLCITPISTNVQWVSSFWDFLFQYMYFPHTNFYFLPDLKFLLSFIISNCSLSNPD